MGHTIDRYISLLGGKCQYVKCKRHSKRVPGHVILHVISCYFTRLTALNLTNLNITTPKGSGTGGVRGALAPQFLTFAHGHFTWIIGCFAASHASPPNRISVPPPLAAPQDAHKRLVLQVYLGSNTLKFSAIHR